MVPSSSTHRRLAVAFILDWAAAARLLTK